MARLALFLAILAASASVPAGAPAASATSASEPVTLPPDDEALPLGTVQLPSGGATVPMESWGGRPVVSVVIDGKGPYRFVLDTGASGGVMTHTLARDLGLRSLREIEVMSPGSSAPRKGSVVIVGEMRIGSAIVQGAALTAMDLSAVFRAEGTPVGVLSAAGFPGHLLTFDYPRRAIRLRAGALPSPDGKRVFAYEALDGLPPLPTVPVTVGGVELLAHLDTGASQALLLPEALVSQVKLRGDLVDVESGATVDRTFRVRAGTLAGRMTIGDYQWEDPLVQFGGLPRANVGGKTLSEFEVTLDASNQRLRLERPGR
jgi:hypothetical protein